MSACTTARRRRWRTSRSTSMRASSSPSSASTAPARPRCSTPSRASCPIAARSVRGGEKLRGTGPAKIARSGLVQCPESRELFGEMTVRENLDLGGQHLADDERATQLAWLFELFPILKERQGQMAQTLSGGEQQMLAIGRALMMQPQILILDEPTLGLAPVILELLSKALDEAAPDHLDHGAARRAERHLRASACRPRLRARARADRMGGRSRTLRRGSRRRLSLVLDHQQQQSKEKETNMPDHRLSPPWAACCRSPPRSRCASPRPPTRSRTIRSRSA